MRLCGCSRLKGVTFSWLAQRWSRGQWGLCIHFHGSSATSLSPGSRSRSGWAHWGYRQEMTHNDSLKRSCIMRLPVPSGSSLASLHLSTSNPSGGISWSGSRGFKIYVKGPGFIELMLLSRTVAVKHCGDLDFYSNVTNKAINTNWACHWHL